MWPGSVAYESSVPTTRAVPMQRGNAVDRPPSWTAARRARVAVKRVALHTSRGLRCPEAGERRTEKCERGVPNVEEDAAQAGKEHAPPARRLQVPHKVEVGGVGRVNVRAQQEAEEGGPDKVADGEDGIWWHAQAAECHLSHGARRATDGHGVWLVRRPCVSHSMRGTVTWST